MTIRQLTCHIKKWLPFFAKGAAILPNYFGYWGFFLAAKRIVKAILLPGFNQLYLELGQFSSMQQSDRKPARDPDFVLMAPDFTGNSAGISSLYQVCADLRAMGFEAAITGSQVGHPVMKTPLLSTREAKRAVRRGAWAIYPEIIHGNPLRAKNVVRWVLNRPGLLGGDEVYADSEHVFVYSDVYTPYVSNPIRGKLYVPTLDRNLFYPPEKADESRSLTTYYVGKSKFKSGYFDATKTFEITRFTPPRSELGKLFRASKVLYCFDNSTALIYEALLCGCPVIILPDGTQTWEDYKTLELGVEGISWGIPEKMPAPVVATELLAKLARTEADYRQQLRFLTDYCQKIAPSRYSPQVKNLRLRERPAEQPSISLETTT